LLFKQRLGIPSANKEILENALKKAVMEGEAELDKIDQYGTHYTLHGYNLHFLLKDNNIV
jgi:hypothetical protein